MNAATLFGLCGAALVGFGLYRLITNPTVAQGMVSICWVAACSWCSASYPGGLRRPDSGAIQSPGMVITAIVVAFAATAMAIALVLRLLQEPGRATLAPMIPEGQVRTRAILMLDANVLSDATRTMERCLCWRSSCRLPAYCCRWPSAGGRLKGLPSSCCLPVSSSRLSFSSTYGEAASG